MNFLLNKIDTDLRRKIYEKTADGKVHRKVEIEIYKDSEKNKGKLSEESSSNKKKKDYKIVVQATKIIEDDITVEAEINDNKHLSNGQILDIRK